MRRATAALVLAVLVGLGVWLYLNRQNHPSKHEDRLPKLTKSVADQEQESVQAVANYHPNAPLRLDDLGSSVVELLHQLPGVVRVEVGVKVENPTCRIIHLRDRHFVPNDLYALDPKDANGRELPAEEIDRLHRELLLEVEAVQLEPGWEPVREICPHGPGLQSWPFSLPAAKKSGHARWVYISASWLVHWP